jgi:hypothetical protein
MSVKNKFLRSIIVCTATVGLATTLLSPTHAADSSDVIGGVFGGLLITKILHKNQNRQINSSIQSQQNHRYNNHNSQHEHKNQRSLYKRGGGRFQHNHGTYSWHYHQQR